VDELRVLEPHLERQAERLAYGGDVAGREVVCVTDMELYLRVRSRGVTSAAGSFRLTFRPYSDRPDSSSSF